MLCYVLPTSLAIAPTPQRLKISNILLL